MKKIIVSIVIGCIAAKSAMAGLVLSDSFNYSNGNLVGASGSPWSAHSGTTAVLVTNNMVRVSTSGSEDVNAVLSGGPYETNGTAILYTSFKIRCIGLPSGTNGTYFAHLKDDGTFNFRNRIYASTNGTVTSGFYRLGIANATNGNSTLAGVTFVPLDLDTNTTYTVVTKYDVANGTDTTLWINPSAETDTANKAVAVDVITNTVPISAFAFRQATGIGTMLIDDLKVGTTFSDVAGANTAPTVSSIPSQNTGAGVTTAAIPFTIGDAETAAGSLNVSATSSNTGLVPNVNISLGGSGADRTATITPVSGQEGSTVITISVSDGVNTSSTQFTLTVGAPTISAVGDQGAYVNQTVGPISFTVNDAESAPGTLTLSGSSSNPLLLNSANISFGGSGANRTVTLAPEAGQSGVSTVTLTVSDGVNSNSTSFTLTVSPSLGIVFADDFNYPDGSLYLNSSGTSPWQHHDPVGANFFEVLATNGTALLVSTNAEDVNAPLTNGPFASDSGIILYTKFDVNFSSLPTPSGNYFVHLKDSGTGFRMKVFASTANAASGSFRLSIANVANSATVAQIPTDLSLNTTYTVVTRYNGGTGISKMWLNPASEASASVTATDASSPITTTAFAFRESSGIGTVSIDDLKVGTSFTDVFTPVATPPSLNVSRVGSSVQISWTTNSAGFVLETKSNLGSGSWTTAPQSPTESNGQLVVTINNPTGNQFYRLKK